LIMNERISAIILNNGQTLFLEIHKM